MTEPRRARGASRLRIVVGGLLGLLPAGGVTWDYVQYPVGFAALGHDVYYIEDTRLWPIYQTDNADGADCSANVAHLAAVMAAFGLAERWAYRDEASGQCFGLSEERVREVCRSADLFVNVSCATVLRDEYRAIPTRALIDTDPMFTQIQYATAASFTSGESGMRGLVDGHTHHFTFGENVGADDCRMPSCGVRWRPTRQPICLAHWPPTALPSDPRAAYTTLMNWTAAPPLVYDGERWGQKDSEFRRLIDVARLADGVAQRPLALAVGQTLGAPFPADEAERAGWQVLDPQQVAADWRRYRRFIQQSWGEFSVAKQTYVKARTGWFSCRSACYLATGRPVIVQDTGWSRYVPNGVGLLAFDDAASALAALAEVAADPAKHARAARVIAEQCFESDRVLSALLREIGA
jgi:hypothetical protein